MTAIVLLVFASGMYLYVRSTSIERVDDTLNHVCGGSDKIDVPVIPKRVQINVAASF